MLSGRDAFSSLACALAVTPVNPDLRLSWFCWGQMFGAHHSLPQGSHS